MSSIFEHAWSYPAPRSLIFDAWTKPEHLKNWWGPAGMKIGTCSLDLAPGGMFHYSMIAPDGNESWGRFVFEEVQAPHRLVWINSFSDQVGGITRHPTEPTWPLNLWCGVDFNEEDGLSNLRMKAHAHEATDQEQKTFASNFDSMKQGFAGTFEQLSQYLKAIVE